MFPIVSPLLLYKQNRVKGDMDNNMCALQF